MHPASYLMEVTSTQTSGAPPPSLPIKPTPVASSSSQLSTFNSQLSTHKLNSSFNSLSTFNFQLSTHKLKSSFNSLSTFNYTPDMTKVFPNSTFPATNAPVAWGSAAADPVVLTVWKKSLLMNCNGFTVYDARGNLLYRVDNYLAGNRSEIVLMDAAGKPLLTLRRKRLGLGDSWMVYDGEKTVDPRFSFRRNVNFRNSKTLGQVTSGNAASTSSPTSSPSKLYSAPTSPRRTVLYDIEGSYSQRTVSFYDTTRRCVAEIKPKQAPGGVALGFDVFRLIISRPYMDTSTAMSLVILIDQIFGSSSYSPKR